MKMAARPLKVFPGPEVPDADPGPSLSSTCGWPVLKWSPDGAKQEPPTSKTDYPELVTSYPEEDYSPLGSLSGHDPQVVLPRRPRRTDALHQPLHPRAAPAGLQANPRNCDTCTSLQPLGLCWALWVRLKDQHRKPCLCKPDERWVQWELLQRQSSKLSIPKYAVELKGASLAWAPSKKMC
ncbi:Rho GTPase-activating protein 27 [Manis javanica]|nr:Rho GTPase-activating protein 27 [Manis javanica]